MRKNFGVKPWVYPNANPSADGLFSGGRGNPRMGWSGYVLAVPHTSHFESEVASGIRERQMDGKRKCFRFSSTV